MADHRWDQVAVAALAVAVFGAGLPAWPDAVRLFALVLAVGLTAVAWRMRRRVNRDRDAASVRGWGGAGDRPAGRMDGANGQVDQRLGGFGAGMG